MEYYIQNTLDLQYLFNDEHIEQFCPSLKKVKPANIIDGVCFNYALNDACLEDCQEAFERMGGYFDPVEFEKCKRDDIVVFFKKYRNEFIPCHFAIFKEKKEYLIDCVVEGKFGNCAVYKHRLIDTPIEYGSMIRFYTPRGLK